MRPALRALALLVPALVTVDRARPPAAPPPTRIALGARTATDSEGPAAARRALAVAGGAVYLGAMFAETDSVIRRWDAPALGALTVAFVPSGLPGWAPADLAVARDAFRSWARVIPGLRVTEVADTAGAEVVVRWIPRFTFDRTGQADLQWDGVGRIRHVDVQLALADQEGRPLGADLRRAVALHEAGHVLGLPHSDDPEDLMYATTRLPRLTSRDTASLRLLYSLSPGSIKVRP
jgi:hypothetical protein